MDLRISEVHDRQLRAPDEHGGHSEEDLHQDWLKVVRKMLVRNAIRNQRRIEAESLVELYVTLAVSARLEEDVCKARVPYVKWLVTEALESIEQTTTSRRALALAL